METKITATELARNLSDILNRVRYKGEHFVVLKNGEAVAEVEPSTASKPYTVGDFRRDFGEVKVPEGLADAIEDGEKALRMMEPSPW